MRKMRSCISWCATPLVQSFLPSRFPLNERFHLLLDPLHSRPDASSVRSSHFLPFAGILHKGVHHINATSQRCVFGRVHDPSATTVLDLKQSDTEILQRLHSCLR